MSSDLGLPLAITGAAATSAVGANLAQTCAAIRAGVAGFGDHADYECLMPEPPLGEPTPAAVAAAPDLPASLGLELRLRALAGRVFRELIRSCRLAREDVEAALCIVCLQEEPRGGASIGDPQAFADALLGELGVSSRTPPQVLTEGRAGVASGLQAAARALGSGQAQRVLLLAIDSYLDPLTLAWLDREYRLKSSRNVDGFIPGEAAVLLSLEAEESARGRGADVLALIRAASLTQEAHGIRSDRRSSGRGLGEAIVAATRSGADLFPWVIADLNGESYRSHEWGLVLTRLASHFGSLRVLEHPADCAGDTGAAAGALQIACACAAFTKRYAPADHALILLCADDEQRAACVISRT